MLTPKQSSVLLTLLILSGAANAESEVERRGVSPRCKDVPKPSDYSEAAQQSFLQNRVALLTLHHSTVRAIPSQNQHRMLGVSLVGAPPVSCENRFALDHTKTEHTNITPVMPRLVGAFGFVVPKAPARSTPQSGHAADQLPLRETDDRVQPGDTTVSLSAGLLPPVTIAGHHISVFSGSVTVGHHFTDGFAAGMRLHTSIARAIGDTAQKSREEYADGRAVEDWRDLYVGSTKGADIPLSVRLRESAGVSDLWLTTTVGIAGVTSHYWVGDDQVMADNWYPYRGGIAAIGLDSRVRKSVYYGVDFLAAPGGRFAPPMQSADPPDRQKGTGSLYTIRVQVGWNP